MKYSSTQWVAAAIFGLAILHTFSVNYLAQFAARMRSGSTWANLLHILGEVEIVFGFWATILCFYMLAVEGSDRTVSYLEGLDFTEALFVFVILIVTSTRPVIEMAQDLILGVAKVFPMKKELAIYMSCLIIGPLMGSLITEPAAMTVTALILMDRYLKLELSSRFKYLTLAVLFVNVSIGGVLTPFSAPPVLMVANKWGWGLSSMLTLFGWKAAIAVSVNSVMATAILRKELSLPLLEAGHSRSKKRSPFFLKLVHVFFITLIVLNVHHSVVFIGVFLLFLGIVRATRHHQEGLKIQESLMVSFFLGGLVVLGGMQESWIRPLIEGLQSHSLFLGATFLTAFTDNAALTYLGSQVPGLSDSFKYFLVAGAVSGGGLTVIANAPNPAGYAILKKAFGDDGVQPSQLFLFGLIPTIIALICFWFL